MNTTMPARLKVSWGFWLRWVLAAVAALAVGLALMIFGVGEAVNNASPLVFGAVIGAVFGAGLGVAQWLVLRGQVQRVGIWPLVTVAVWIGFWALNMVGLFGQGSGLVGKAVEGLAHGALFGGLLGVAQWAVLRRNLSQAGWWILISALSWALAAALGDSINVLMGGDGPFEILIALLLSGALTGVGMVWLLRPAAAKA